MEKQNIKDRSVNFVYVTLTTESGCNPKEGEYSLSIRGLCGGLDISSFGGVDDISLIKECVENVLDFEKLPEEGQSEIILKESG